MALDKLVDSTQLDSDLTSVANAIRTKGGTSAQLAFPAGFVSAINDISGGGGYSIDEFLAKNVITSYTTERTSIPYYGLYYQTALATVSLPKVTSVGLSAFEGCSALSGSLVLPAIVTLNNYAFKGVAVSGVDMGSSMANFGLYSFQNAANFGTLVIRKSSVVALPNINVFNGTKFASGKAGGTLYVPNDLLASYQSASNWSTILGYATNSIKSIESTHTDPNAPVDLTTHYLDGTTIPT